MTNDEISDVLRNISYLIQIRDDEPFRARIYERAADSIDALGADVRQWVEEGTLQSIPGIGKAIAAKIIEMLETGRCRFYDDLIQEMGAGVLELLSIRGVGVKTAGRFYHELGVRSLADLRVAIDNGHLKSMKRMGAKTIATIDAELRFVEAQRKTRPLGYILPIAQAIFDVLKSCPEIKRLEFAGDFRRREEILQCLEFAAECSHPGAIAQALSGIAGVESPSIQNPVCVTASVDSGFPLRVYCFNAVEYEAGLITATGTDEHIAKLNQIAEAQNLAAIRAPFPTWSQNRTEADIYARLGLPFIVPELRVGTDAIDAALAGNLPTLVELGDLRCDLHLHTNWSDGRNTIREMVETAKALGHEYIAITDHSQSSRVANGLSPERLLEQMKQIRDLNAEIDGIEVLAGSEVDILRDGSLDFPDEILAQLDIVVASVHSGFALGETEMTERMIRAIENPFVKIIGHPTGRLLGRRSGYAINLEAVIDAAAAHGVALEINAAPSRLDIGPSPVRKARACGVLLSINTDAHATSQLDRGILGINVARRGGLEKEDVLNTYSLAALRGRIR
jgi:DNA polymerase (family 10)